MASPNPQDADRIIAQAYKKEHISSPQTSSSRSPPFSSSWSSSLLFNINSLTRLRSFFTFDDIPLPATVTRFPAADSAAAKTRLEVLTSSEITFTTVSLYISAAIAFIFTLYTTLNLRSAGASAIPEITPSRALVAFFLNLISFLLAVLFTLRLTLGPEPLQHEQISTAILLSTGFLFRSPLIFTPRTSAIIQILMDSLYAFTCCFYLFSAAHSYRILNSAHLSREFYLPKLFFISLYILTKIALTFLCNLSLPLIPFSALIPYIFLISSHRVTLLLSFPIITMTLLDSILFLALTKQITTTALTLKGIPYLRYRAKQLGFRCFVYQSLAFANTVLFLSFTIALATPKQILFSAYDAALAAPAHALAPHAYLRLESQVGGLALALVYTMWTVVLAYVNLPPGPLWPWGTVESLGRQLVRKVRRWGGWPVEEEEEHGAVEGDSGTDVEEGERDEKEAGEGGYLGMLGRVLGSAGGTVYPFRYSHREWRTYSRGAKDVGRERQKREEIFSGWFSPPTVFSPTLSEADTHLFSPTYGSMSQAGADAPRERPRLGMKKNLLVMETQAMLVNAAYLSYVPGNPREEANAHRSKYISSQSLSYLESRQESEMEKTKPEKDDNLLDLWLPVIGEEGNVAQEELLTLEDKKEDKSRSREGALVEVEKYVQIDKDDGRFFRVDVAQLVEDKGYELVAHFVDDELNAHAIILSGIDRVIVAFSGTRNVRNWATNMRFSRATWNELFRGSPFVPPPTFIEHVGQTNVRQSEQAKASGAETKQTTRIGEYGSLGYLEQTVKRRKAKRRRGIGIEMSKIAAEIGRELMTMGQPKVHRGFGEMYRRLRFPIFDTLKRMYCEQKGRLEDENESVDYEHDDGNEAGYYKESMEYSKQDTGFWENLRRANSEGRERDSGRRRGVDKASKRSRSAGGGGDAVGKRLFFCGHSLGGAMATYASYDACRHWKELGVTGRDDIACTTFGCPKVGNTAFQARYNATVLMHWRFELAGDPVVGMPSVLNYVHVGTQALLDRSGELLIDPSFVERAWWGSLAGVWGGYRLHIRASYVEALKCYARKFGGGEDPLDDVFWPFPTTVQTRGLFSFLADSG